MSSERAIENQIYQQVNISRMLQKNASPAAKVQPQPEQVADQVKGKLFDHQNTRTADGAIRWTVVSKSGKAELQALPNTLDVDVSTVTTHDDLVESPRLIDFLGYKIDLSAKVAGYKDLYMRNFSLSRSHNLMVARFAEFKVGLFGFLLSMMGVSSADIRKLQRAAMEKAVNENRILFEENEYNAELIVIIGGSKKQRRVQQRVVGEIRKQLITQANRLGLKDYYTQEKITDIQKEQCQKILWKFIEEKMNLNYKLDFMFGGN